ncbi:hypothetical protein [Thermocoleostomius sinensis]|uniref:Uncharacterized protein n=1 Tax=Thermocoleostomius sinensis A174 TaxID=2016057 RepID=A0A9E8ZIC2_9CYAN|nr:hypothetical protein [Thermocoleostomius sinensis]WAL61808.1 hypothetical protein OXH18_07440 [Thermocoleostomius sinensis A174]
MVIRQAADKPEMHQREGDRPSCHLTQQSPDNSYRQAMTAMALLKLPMAMNVKNQRQSWAIDRH